MAKIECSKAKEILPYASLVSVRPYEVSGKRAINQKLPEEQIDSELESMLDYRDEVLRFRVRQKVTTREAVLLADIEVIYDISSGSEDEVSINSSAQREFAEKVGFMALVPYLRQSLQDSASRLGVRVPVLGIVKQGDFRLVAEGVGVDSDVRE